jgi:hypothetical protein
LKIKEDNGEIVLESAEVNVKITTNRDIYMRTPKQGEFKPTGHKVPLGMSIEQKAIYALRLRNQYIQKFNEENNPQNGKGDSKGEGEQSPKPNP